MRSPRSLKSRPREAEVIPFPRLEATPPVTKMNFVVSATGIPLYQNPAVGWPGSAHVRRPRWSNHRSGGTASTTREIVTVSAATWRSTAVEAATTTHGVGRIAARPAPATRPRGFDPASPSMPLSARSNGRTPSAAPSAAPATRPIPVSPEAARTGTSATIPHFAERPGRTSRAFHRFAEAATRTAAAVTLAGPPPTPSPSPPPEPIPTTSFRTPVVGRPRSSPPRWPRNPRSAPPPRRSSRSPAAATRATAAMVTASTGPNPPPSRARVAGAPTRRPPTKATPSTAGTPRPAWFPLVSRAGAARIPRSDKRLPAAAPIATATADQAQVIGTPAVGPPGGGPAPAGPGGRTRPRPAPWGRAASPPEPRPDGVHGHGHLDAEARGQRPNGGQAGRGQGPLAGERLSDREAAEPPDGLRGGPLHQAEAPVPGLAGQGPDGQIRAPGADRLEEHGPLPGPPLPLPARPHQDPGTGGPGLLRGPVTGRPVGHHDLVHAGDGPDDPDGLADPAALV